MFTAFFQVALPVVIALLGVIIAWQQWQTNRNQLRLALHKERFEIYNAAMQFIALVVQKGDVSQDAVKNFLVNTKRARFLFNQKIQEYLDNLYKEAVAVYTGQVIIEHPA